jgi:hypothetical protein
MMLQGLVMGGTAEKRIKYGNLYNLPSMIGTGISSILSLEMEVAGWHVPLIISDVINGIELVLPRSEFGKAKATGLIYWSSPNTGAENKYNLNFLGCGERSSTGVFSSLNGFASIKTLYPITYPNGWAYMLYSTALDAGVAPFSDGKIGTSVRLVRPATAPEQLLSDGTYMDKYVGNDGQKYLTVKIGTQVWMAENLAETKYRNGDAIPNVTDNTAWAALTTGARCAYGNNESNVFI